jgi:OmpA-OmpF porin, OOP family
MKDNIALILGILGLILAWFLCLGAPKTVAPVAVAPPPAVITPAPVAAPAPIPATARMNVSADRKVVLEGTVRDDAVKTGIVTQANALYGAPNVTDNLKIDGQVAELKSIVIVGDVASDQIKTATGDTVKKGVGADVTVDNQLRVVAPPVAQIQGDQIKTLLTGRTIEFFTGSAIITPVGQKILNELVPVLEQDKTTRVEIQGHTDNVGDPASNQRLSEARAASTRQYLVARGIDAARLTPKGYGQDKPISGNETVEGRQHNRRISFQVEGK